MNVLLTTINSKYIHQNLAIRLLYELNKDFDSLKIHEFSLKNSTDEIATFCNKFDIIAFSCYIWNITKTLEAAKAIKGINPTCKILLGGPEVSYEWEEIIALPEVDFIILDEGETPFAEFLASYPTFKIVPGLVWKSADGKVHQNSPVLFNLDHYRNINPYLSIPLTELKHKIGYIEASRGCPNQCAFCLAGLQNKLRYLPKQALQTNLLYLMEHGRVIKFLDRTFNTHPDYAIEVFRFILDHYKEGNIFQFEIKADHRQPELIEFIKKNVPKGLFRFEIGIQTLTAKANQEVNRRQDFENIKWFIEQVADKVEIHLDLIVGLPHDYYDDIKYSFEEVFKLFAPELQLGFLKFLKGTPIRQNASLHNFSYQANPPYQIIESNYLSANELADFEDAEDALDIYWNKKRTIHTLRYIALNYSIFDFLNGLGRFLKAKNQMENKGLTHVYKTIFDFATGYFSNDILVPELIALDYYLQHKIKPATLFLPELNKTERKQVVDRLKLNHHKYRHAIHNIHFDVQQLIEFRLVKPKDDLLIIEYSGVDKPRVIFE